MKSNLPTPPLPASYLDVFSLKLSSGNSYVNKNTRLIFVCGSNEDGARREIFLNYASKHLGEYYFFKAENIFKTLEQNKKDLLSIENDIALYSDCIMVILESPGSIAELGAFAMLDALMAKMLVINNIEYSGSESFINKGPIEKINLKSIFGECIWSNYPEISTVFSNIKKRIDRSLYRRRLSENVNLKCNADAYIELSNNKKTLLCLLADIIKIFGPISKKEVLGVISHHFKISSKIDIETEMGLLNATGIVSRGRSNGDYYVRNRDRNNYFLSYSTSMERLRARILNYYAKSSRDRLKCLEENE